MKNYTLLLLFLNAFIAFSQTPCENGFAGQYPCNDYDLLSHVPISILANTSGNPEGSDVWGWTDTSTGKEYAIAAMTNSTAFVDISDPVNPIFLGRLDTENGNTSFWRDVKIYNNHAFIVADNVGFHGMQVFDLTRLRGLTSPPIDPEFSFIADSVFNGVGSCHNIVINEQTAVAYLVGCNTFSGGIHFVDISNPKNPIDAGGYSAEGYTHDAQVLTYNGPDTDYTGKEIYIGSNENEVVVLDVTDKGNVVKISDIVYPQIGYTHQGWFTEDQKYFILGDETDELNLGFNTRTLIFDFSDLDNPQFHAAFEGPTQAIDHNGYVKGNFYYLANYTRGLRVFDISSILQTINPMTEIGGFDTFPENDGTSFNGAWGVYPYFNSENIIINDIDRGLFIVRQSGTASTNNPVEKIKISLFPNPVENGKNLRIKTDETIQTIEIFSVLGSRIQRIENIRQTQYDLPINNLTNGIYIAKINGVLTTKFIVE